jgi:hypothetical protein
LVFLKNEYSNASTEKKIQFGWKPKGELLVFSLPFAFNPIKTLVRNIKQL